jgi:hypothetical protein
MDGKSARQWLFFAIFRRFGDRQGGTGATEGTARDPAERPHPA